MIGRWGLYRTIQHTLRNHGVAQDAAADAARELVRTLRAERDYQIRAAYSAGRSIRQLAKRWGLSKSGVQLVVSSDQVESGHPASSLSRSADKPASVGGLRRDRAEQPRAGRARPQLPGE